MPRPLNIEAMLAQLRKRSGRNLKDRLLKTTISGFIIIYFTAVIAWLCPEAKSPFKDAILERFTGILMFTGVQQRWTLFSPHIRTMNFHAVALLTFADGTNTIWAPRYMEYASPWEKFTKDKYRKWSVDNLCWEVPYKAFWPDFARYVGRLHYDPCNKPVSLTMFVFRGEIPEPAKEISRFRLPDQTLYHIAFNYRYHPEDFK